MSLDGIVTRNIVYELKSKLINGKINKIYQPELDEVTFLIRNKGKNYKLLISANSNNPRIHLTKEDKSNPMVPPMFCMILRKYFIGSTILNIKQYQMDRIISLDLTSRDELGVESINSVIIEIMGRHSNIIIINKDSGKIIDSIKRIPATISSIRQVLPGLIYSIPPTQNKLNPLKVSKEDFLNIIYKNNEKLEIFKFFYLNFIGLSPLISKEICSRAKINKNKKIKDLSKEDIMILFSLFEDLVTRIKNNRFKPSIIYDDNNRLLSFYSLPLNQFKCSKYVEYSSISNLLDDLFFEKDTQDRIYQKSSSLKKIVNTQLNKTVKKLSKQKFELEKANNREIFKVYADLISANLYRINHNTKSIIVENFYDESLSLIEIPLDSKISPALNAQKYYKKYSRLKNRRNLLNKQIPKTEEEIKYLNSVLTNIDNSDDINDLDEIRDELIDEKIILKRKKNKKKESTINQYLSTNGFIILVGKNNRQNDLITFKKSSREDLWFHAQNIPGAHVILKTGNGYPQEDDIKDAALLAAYYSQGRLENNINVDYTERKNVKKQRSSRPGLVFYDNFKTITIQKPQNNIKNIKK